MAIFRYDVPYYSEIFSLPGFLRDPILVFGFQDVYGFRPTQLQNWNQINFFRKIKKAGLQLIERYEVLVGKRHPYLTIPDQFKQDNLTKILVEYGCQDVKTLDLFDARADFSHDMNQPIPAELRDRFNTILEIGCTEHVFDTRQCMENLFSMLRLNGYLLMHTPCKGWFKHGLHTFSPECILECLHQNGFEIQHIQYSNEKGMPLKDPNDTIDVNLRVVAKKIKEITPFQVPQQGRWKEEYGKAK